MTRVFHKDLIAHYEAPEDELYFNMIAKDLVDGWRKDFPGIDEVALGELTRQIAETLIQLHRSKE